VTRHSIGGVGSTFDQTASAVLVDGFPGERNHFAGAQRLQRAWLDVNADRSGLIEKKERENLHRVVGLVTESGSLHGLGDQGDPHGGYVLGIGRFDAHDSGVCGFRIPNRVWLGWGILGDERDRKGQTGCHHKSTHQ
jgi:hypothetical protein